MKKNTCLLVTVVLLFLSMSCAVTAYSAQLEQDQAQEEIDYGSGLKGKCPVGRNSGLITNQFPRWMFSSVSEGIQAI